MATLDFGNPQPVVYNGPEDISSITAASYHYWVYSNGASASPQLMIASVEVDEEFDEELNDWVESDPFLFFTESTPYGDLGGFRAEPGMLIVPCIFPKIVIDGNHL